MPEITNPVPTVVARRTILGKPDVARFQVSVNDAKPVGELQASLLAGERALATYADEDALTHFDRV